MKRSVLFLCFLGGIALLTIHFMVLFELTPDPQMNGNHVSTEIYLTRNLFGSNHTGDFPKNHPSGKNYPLFLAGMSQTSSSQDFFTSKQLLPVWGTQLILKQPVIPVLFLPIIIRILFFSIFYQSSRMDSDDDPSIVIPKFYLGKQYSLQLGLY